jgi:lactate dehydrogenase-like 2-hydroxyacid dehydrogenase
MPEANTPTVLLSHPMLLFMAPDLGAEGWRVVRAWEMPEAEREAVRVIVHPGEVPLTPPFLESLPRLGLIACMSVGYDGVDVAWCRGHGIEVTHATSLNAEDAAELALGLVIAGWREIVAGDRMIRDGQWSESHRLPMRPSVHGRRLGIVGLGAIGRASAVRAQACGLEIGWWEPWPKPDAPWPRHSSLLDLAAWSDILLVTASADAANRGMISREIIEAVGPQGMIVNVARGALVDEDALIAALQDGRLGRAALDVFQQEPTPTERWAGVPNTVLTPHAAGVTADAQARMASQTLENLRCFFGGRPVVSPVPPA